MVDAARLADELRAEQDHAQTQEKLRKALETQIKELQVFIYSFTQSLRTDASQRQCPSRFTCSPDEYSSSNKTSLNNQSFISEDKNFTW